MSRSSPQQTTTQTQAPNSDLMPYLSGYLGQAAGAASLPYSPYMGQRVAGPSQTQVSALRGIQGAMGGTRQTQQAADALSSVFANQGNPNLQGVRDRVSRDVTSQYNDATANTTARFSRGGTFGSSAHQQAQQRADESLARGLGDALSQADYGAYESGQNRVMNAVPLAYAGQQNTLNALGQGLNAGGLVQNYEQRLLDSQLGDFQGAQDWPYKQVDFFGNALGRLGGQMGGTTTQMSPGPDRLSQGIGGAALLGSIFAPRGGATGGAK
jgi:hypothetical protein